MSALDWHDNAACRGADRDLFYPPRGSTVARDTAAKAFCRRCPVREPCLADALAQDDQWGTAGGLTARERRELLRASARGGVAA